MGIFAGFESPILIHVSTPDGFSESSGDTIVFNGHSYAVLGGNNITLSVDGSSPSQSIGESSVGAPQLAVFNGQLHLAWTGTNSDNNLNVVIIATDPVTGAVLGEVPGSKIVLGFTSNHGPALASIDGGLVLVWAGKAHDEIDLDFINTGLQTANSKPNFGPDATVSDDRTRQQPHLTVFNNQLFLTWTGTDGGFNIALVNHFVQESMPAGG